MDVVALFSAGPQGSPSSDHRIAIQQIRNIMHGKQLALVLYQPDMALDPDVANGRLPISTYAFHHETGFASISYEIETEEAELIGLNYIARGGANAHATDSSSNSDRDAQVAALLADSDRQSGDNPSAANTKSAYTPADDEMLFTLKMQYDAVKMLRQRIGLMRHYLTSLPRSYLTDSALSIRDSPQLSSADYAVLRNILALLSRLVLLSSVTTDAQQGRSDSTTLTPDMASNLAFLPISAISTPHTQQPTSVENATTNPQPQSDQPSLISLLSTLTKALAQADSMNEKYRVVRISKAQNRAMDSPLPSESQDRAGLATYGSSFGNEFEDGFADGGFVDGTAEFLTEHAGSGLQALGGQGIGEATPSRASAAA